MRTRKKIRQKIVELLKGQTAAGDRVYVNYLALWDKEKERHLPAIVVHALTEDVEEFERAPRSFRRNTQWSIEVHARDTELKSAQDTIDDIVEEIEAILYRTHNLDGECDWVEPGNYDFEFSDRAAQLTGCCRMAFITKYVTDEPESSTEQGVKDALDTVNAKIGVGHDSGDPDEIYESEQDISIETS